MVKDITPEFRLAQIDAELEAIRLEIVSLREKNNPQLTKIPIKDVNKKWAVDEERRWNINLEELEEERKSVFKECKARRKAYLKNIKQMRKAA